MDTLEYATSSGPLQRIQVGNITPTWKGPIYAESGPTIAFVKILEPNQLLSEAACTLLGRALGLAMPKGYIVQIHRSSIPDYENWKDGEDHRIGFGSQDANHPSFRQYIEKGDKSIINQLLKWTGLYELAVFDEWVANVDRNAGNILYDGTGMCVPIDHSHAFTGPSWQISTLIPDVSVKNLLIDELINKDDIKKQKLKKIVPGETIKCKGIPLNELKNNTLHGEYITDEYLEAMLYFLKERIELLIGLIQKRLGTPELGL